MSTVTTTASFSARALGRRQRGWIGLDCGVRTIKIAQLERAGDNYRFSARWAIQPADSVPLDRDVIAAGGLKSRLASIQKMMPLLAGRNCAAVLPTPTMDFRMFELPQADVETESAMVAEALATELGIEPSEFSFDYWRNTVKDLPPAQLSPVTVLATPKTVVRSFADQLLSAGLECSVLDGLPCALARAVNLVYDTSDEPAVALDLAYSTPVFVLVHHGRPIFSRALRGGSVQSLMQPLQEALQISPDECEHLLENHGVPSAAGGVVAQRIFKVISPPLHNMVVEVERTLMYLAQQFRKLRPRQMWLFGSGAKIKHLPEYLGERLHLPAAPWGLSHNADAGDAEFGVAAALSALAWEDGQ
jgi:type IV pilus assembly protein PilM